MKPLALTVTLFLIFNIAMAQTHDKSTQLKFLALGDSYTIGESVAEDQRWPEQLVRALSAKGKNFAKPKIIATTGWRTDDLKNAILKENPENDYDLVSLLIGVNDQYQHKPISGYPAHFEELLRMAIAFAGGDRTKVFVVSIPDYGFTPFGKDKRQTISSELNEYNRINKEIADKLGVRYFNITEISRKGFEDPDLVASDGLHPSGKMYSQWVKVILAGLQ